MRLQYHQYVQNDVNEALSLYDKSHLSLLMHFGKSYSSVFMRFAKILKPATLRPCPTGESI